MMRRPIRWSLQLLLPLLAVTLRSGPVRGSEQAAVRIATPMPPPAWALLERELLRAQSAPAPSSSTATSTTAATSNASSAGAATTGRTTPSRTSTTGRSSTLWAAADSILARFKKAWEGHLRQYTAARTTEVPFARDGMYYKEFPVMFDWLHLGEGLIGLQPPGPLRPAGLAVPAAGHALRGLLPERRPRRTELRPQASRSSAACSTAAGARCSARRRPSTGPATRSRSRAGSGSGTASTPTPRCSSTSRTTTTSSATTP